MTTSTTRVSAEIAVSTGLRAYDVYFNYAHHAVLRGTNLHVESGEVLALLGGNGAGKSTLLRLMLGLLKPNQGTVSLNGRLLQTIGTRLLAQKLAYVPQAHIAPFPYKVKEIAMLGRIPAHGLTQAENGTDTALVDEVLQRMGIAHLAERSYTEISGGERQLTLLSRALVQGARTLVMDEPMNGLDYGHQIRLLEHLRHLAREGYAILMTTHHPEHALLAATRVALLEGGSIVNDGDPRDVVTPATIKRLYDVDVQAFQSPLGHTAFYPTGHDA